MSNETGNRIRLGIFVIAGSILLIAGFYLIGQNKNLFGRTFSLVTRFDNIGGLQRGNNVRFSGIDVGTVESIDILDDTTIEITLTIDQKMKTIIRKNAVATIGTDGLMGNKLINIEPGTADEPFVSEGDTITSKKSVDTEKMLRTLASTNSNVERISSNLFDLTERINLSRGTLYTMLMDTAIAVALQSTMENIEKVSLHLSEFSKNLSAMSNDVKSGKGVLGALVNDTTQVHSDLKETMSHLNKSGQQMEAAVHQINQLLESIRNGKGSLTALVNDSIMAGQLKRSMKNIDSSAMKLNENMEALKHNFLTRGYFKNLERNSKK